MCCPNTQSRDKFFKHDFAFCQAFGVDIHQRNMSILERIALQHVTDDIFHENSGASSDKGDFGISSHFLCPHIGLCRNYIECRVDKTLSISILGGLKDLTGRSLFNHIAVLHHDHIVTECFDDLQVMADKHIAQVMFSA